MNDFTHFVNKLVFSFKSAFVELMSKLRSCMHQVSENATHAGTMRRQPIEFMSKIMRCSVFLLCAAILVACGQHKSRPTGQTELGAEGPVGRELTRGLPGEPRTLDPQLADDTYSSQVIRDLYEGLTSEDRSGKVVPGVASSWTVDPTGTTYTFQLREEARWSNGDRIFANEFVEGLRRAVDPKTASGSAALLSIIKGASDITAGRKKPTDLRVTAISASSIQIELERPAPYLLEILSQPIAAPFHAQNNLLPASSGEMRAHVVTNGPYILKARVPGSFIELERNIRYWDAAHVAIERVRYVNAESEATEVREYAAGQLDMTFTIPTPDVKRLAEKYGNQVQIAPILATQYLAFNLSEPPMRDNRDLRQALSMAVDRDFIAEYVIEGVTPAYSFVAKGINGYVSPEYAWASWSRERRLDYARRLFLHAGYSERNPLRLKLYFSRDEGLQRLMVAVAGSWKQNLGVESELISDEFRVFLAGRRDKKRWDVARIGWTADYDDPTSFLDVFASGSSENDGSYLSPAFNESLNSAEMEPNGEKRTELLRRAEQSLLDDYPIVPIYFYNSRRLVKPDIGGATTTPMNRTYTKQLFWRAPP